MVTRSDVESRRWQLSCAEETRDVARTLSEGWDRGTAVALIGPLGAGKTTFVRGAVEAMGGDPRRVRSPTFVLVREYPEAEPTVAHADLYRVHDGTAQRTIGLGDYLGRTLLLVEWAQHWRGSWPASTETVRMAHAQDGGRTLTWTSGSPADRPEDPP